MNEATARPWTVTEPSDGHHGDKGDYAILDSGGFIIAECFLVVEKDEYRPAGANAALIVKAVNRDAAFDRLVEALEKIAGPKLPPGDWKIRVGVLQAIAHAALEEAKP